MPNIIKVNRESLISFIEDAIENGHEVRHSDDLDIKYESDGDSFDSINIIYNSDCISTLDVIECEHIHAWSSHPLVPNYKICNDCKEDNYKDLTNEEKSQIDSLRRFQDKFIESKVEDEERSATRCYHF